MRETLTVELDSELVERLHRYCREQDTPVAVVLSGLIAALPISDSPGEEDWVRDLPPITRRLLGAGSGPADEADYKEYLLRKYGPLP